MRNAQPTRQIGIVLMAFGIILGLSSGLAAPRLAQAGADIPQLPELNWQKCSDWLDVTKDITPRPVGDGVADDAAAVQAAFEKVRSKGSPFSTAYFPPGTYRITKTIDLNGAGKSGPMHLRNQGRSSRIVRDGAEGGRVYRIAGASLSTYIGVVWDGRGKAAEGIVHSGRHETKVPHQHEAFLNFTEFGCGAVKRYIESSDWRNCLFVNCGKYLNDQELMNLSQRQFGWFLGWNPFNQSLLWGEGYRYQGMFCHLTNDLVGGVPCKVYTRDNRDVPYWPSDNWHGPKEVWSHSSSDYLWLMTHLFQSSSALAGRDRSPADSGRPTDWSHRE